MSTAAFPTIAEYVSRGMLERGRTIILETLRSILFLSLPSSIGLMILGLPIIQALLQHGLFSLSDAQSTAITLTFFAIGLAGFSAVEILTRAFYAMRDSKTPVIVSVSQFILKIALSLILLDPFAFFGGPSWGMGALSFATAISSIGKDELFHFSSGNSLHSYSSISPNNVSSLSSIPFSNSIQAVSIPIRARSASIFFANV